MTVSDLYVFFLKTYSYDFRLTYRKGFRSSEAEVKVQVLACSPPKVTIDALKSGKFNTEDEIMITGQVAAVALKVYLEYSFVSGNGMYRDQGSVTNRFLTCYIASLIQGLRHKHFFESRLRTRVVDI